MSNRLLGAIVVIALVGVLGAAYAIAHSSANRDIWSSLWTVVLGALLTVAILSAADSKQSFLNYLLFAVSGGAIGWVVGILATPATADEERIFGEYKTAIVGFISGFAVSKANDVWRLLTEGSTPRLFSMNVLTRVLLFVSMFFLLVAQQYSVRKADAGRVLVSAMVEPPAALLQRTLGTLSVKPGAELSLKGAAAYPDMDVDWSVRHDSKLAEVVTLTGSTLAVPDVSQLQEIQSGDVVSVVATSRWNRSTQGVLQVILVKDEAPRSGAGAVPER